MKSQDQSNPPFGEAIDRDGQPIPHHAFSTDLHSVSVTVTQIWVTSRQT
jgi:hypothetical protein